jgi:DTW domain-containing protein YfiP
MSADPDGSLVSLRAPTLEARVMRSRRAERCAGCGLTPCLCLCAEVTALATRTSVLVLVHRVEVHKPTNTARLAARCLSQATLRMAGQEPAAMATPDVRRLVLFPAPEARTLREGEGLSGQPLRLVVPDGTWTQARRISRRDPWAQNAELVCLPEGASTRYHLRRNVRPGGLCTFEAIARALAIVERPELEEPLLAILDRFVERSHRIRSGAAPAR